jgi:hypothetical protein
MPTTTFNCTGVRGFTTVWKQWSSGSAYQGQLSGKDCGGEIGFDFSALGPLSNIAISAIKLTFHAGDKGGSYKKYLNLRIGSFNGSSATLVGAFGFSSLYNTTKSINFSASSNAAGFNTLKNYILGGGSTLNTYVGSTRGKSSSKSFDYDYMNVTSMSLEITYTYLKSTGSIEAAQTGSDATLAITAYNSAYSHVVTWRMGGNSHTQSVAAGAASASYTIPHSWLPDAETGTATVELETLDGNGDSLGSNVYSFALSVPASVVPSIGSLTVTPVNAGASSAAAAWGLYIQNKTRAAAAIGNASAGSGAAITAYAISTSPNFGSAALSSLTTELLTAAGTVTFTAVVTDSRGRTATATAAITVQAYAAPVFTATPAVYRCGQDGTRNDTGGVYAKLTAAFSCSSILDGSTEKNSFTVAKVTLNSVDANLTSGTPAIIGAGALSVDSSYEAVITLVDAVGGQTTFTVTIPSAKYVLHVRKGGRSIGIFRAAGTTDDDTLHIGGHMALEDNPLPVGSGGTGQTSLQAARNAMGLGNTTGALPVANGGTGQTSLQAARNAMGLGNTTGELPVANGGTGASTAAGARANLGAACGVYDTSGEIDTGNDWIDGKRIYRRVCTSTASAREHAFSTTGWDMDRPIHMYGTASFTDGSSTYWVPATDAEGNGYSVSISHHDNTLYVWSGSRTITNVAVIIEYTKTT